MEQAVAEVAQRNHKVVENSRQKAIMAGKDQESLFQALAVPLF